MQQLKTLVTSNPLLVQSVPGRGKKKASVSVSLSWNDSSGFELRRLGLLNVSVSLCTYSSNDNFIIGLVLLLKGRKGYKNSSA